ncbi:MAG: PLP-dependent aminotransferase family protein [Gammaproteobacteria bacterium]
MIEQLHTRLLPRRGVWAEPEEILVTVGAQHALYLLASLLLSGKTIGMEEPGYPDARNIFELHAAQIVPLPVDAQGLQMGAALDACDYVYVTPSHQSPTTVTLSLERRQALLERARQRGFVIIEDDYESETNYAGQPIPALKSLDNEGRVIYVGSLSKTLAPGLRQLYGRCRRPDL